MAIWDVAVGHREALARAVGNENVRDFYLDARAEYHVRALPDDQRGDKALLSKLSSEMVLAEAMYFNADVVFIVAGLNFHPAALWLLDRAHIPAFVFFTESPYEDEFQSEWASASPTLGVFTNDSFSARKFNWTYVPHAFNPAVHRPGGINIDLPRHDVVLVGSGWAERQQLLEAIDWTGINLGLYGVWNGVVDDSYLAPHLRRVGNVKNSDTVQLYRNSKIVLNIHRASATAESMGPRCYEVAATGTFQLSDVRMDLPQVFGESIPTFTSAADLEQKIRHYLKNESERQQLASMALTRVSSHTFDARTPILLDSFARATRTLKETV
jgi:spore maturation protein CgeB